MHIVLCGSMSAAQALLDISDRLQAMGHVTVLPENIHAHAEAFSIESTKEKNDLDVFKKYFAEIKQSDAILVVNESKGERKDYIGPNTFIEMAFAHVLDKPIYVLHDIPDSDFRDEINAMHPIALHSSLNHFSV